MRKFYFDVIATPTKDDFWVDICPTYQIDRENVEEGIRKVFEELEENYGIDVSKNSRKNAEVMYKETPSGVGKQVGYVFKGSIQVPFDERTLKKRFVDLWIEIKELNSELELTEKIKLS